MKFIGYIDMKFYVLNAAVKQESLVSELNPVIDLKILPIEENPLVPVSIDSTIGKLAEAFHQNRDVFIETTPPSLTFPLVIKNLESELCQTKEDKRLVRVIDVAKESDDVDYYTLSVEMITPIDEVPDYETLVDQFIDMVLDSRFIVREGSDDLELIAFTVSDEAKVKLVDLSIIVLPPHFGGLRVVNELHEKDGFNRNNGWINSRRSFHLSKIDLEINEKHLWEKNISEHISYINGFAKYDKTLIVVSIKYCLGYTDIVKSRRLLTEVLGRQLGELASDVIVLNKKELGDL